MLLGVLAGQVEAADTEFVSSIKPTGGDYSDLGTWNANTAANLTLATTASRWDPLSLTGTPPSARAKHHAAFDSVSNAIYVFGGSLDGYNAPFDDDVYIYDIAGDTWSKADETGWSTRPVGRVRFGSAFDETAREMYIISSKDTDDVWAYSIPTNTWRKITNYTPAGLGEMTAGGFDQDWRIVIAYSTQLRTYDVVGNAWPAMTVTGAPASNYHIASAAASRALMGLLTGPW